MSRDADELNKNIFSNTSKHDKQIKNKMVPYWLLMMFWLIKCHRRSIFLSAKTWIKSWKKFCVCVCVSLVSVCVILFKRNQIKFNVCVGLSFIKKTLMSVSCECVCNVDHYSFNNFIFELYERIFLFLVVYRTKTVKLNIFL